MSKKPDDDKKHPAVVYAHGDFAFGASPDQKYNFSNGWEKSAPFDLKNSKEIELHRW